VAVLGIEGTAHTLGVGIVEAEPGRPDRCRIRANERSMLRPPEPAPGEAALGIHPRLAAHHHADVAGAVVHAALAAADIAPADLDGIAFSRGPGLGPCLRVAATVARALALRYDLPLAGVNHCVAHLEIGRGLTDARDPVLLYASGANTQVIAFARGRYRVFGETLDIGIGNGLDKFARDNGIPFPGGPRIEAEAATVADRREAFHPLPYTVKGMDLCFAGTALSAQRLVAGGIPFPEACHSLQETAFAALVEITERALAHTGKTEVVLGGGVACNQRLQDMVQLMCVARGADFYCPPRSVLVDNGAMIAWLGHKQLVAQDSVAVVDSGVLPYQRTDRVEVTWR
jgi:glycoprotease/Kae1 family metallohydrolase